MRGGSENRATPHLGRLLKKTALLELLQQGRAVLRQRAELAVLADGLILAATAEVDHAPRPDDCRFPLTDGTNPLGELLIRRRGNDKTVTTEEAERVGQLLATALQGIMKSEAVRRAVVDDALEQYRESALIRNTMERFNSSLRLDEVSRALLYQCRAIVPQAAMGMVFSKQPRNNGWDPLASFGTNTTTSLAGIVTSRLFADILSSGKEEIVNGLHNDKRWASEVPGIEALICLPLRSPGHWTGALVLASCRPEATFNSLDLKPISILAGVAATAMANAHHFEEVQAMQEALLQALATAIDSRDPCTAGHSQRVALYAVAMAKRISANGLFFPDISFSSEGLQELFYAGMLHDVGKIGIRESVLTKATRLLPGQLEIIGQRMAMWGVLQQREWLADFKAVEAINRANVITPEDVALIERLGQEKLHIGEQCHPLLKEEEKERLLIARGNLSPEEWQEIKNHPAEGCRILQHIPFPETLGLVLPIIRQHHEKPDGTGYPAGIDGESLHLQSRILALVDIYDALTAKDRPYKRALPRDKALDILRDEARHGKMDHDLLTIFSEHIEEIEKEVHSAQQQGASQLLSLSLFSNWP